jgi:hypothetical protein
MRTTRLTLVALLSLALLAGSCGDDDEDVGTGATGSGAGDGPTSSVELPAGSPDLAGTITSVSRFEPVTEDCTPAEDLDPDGAVSSDDPPVCTPEDNDVVGTVLVEEQPGVQEGRKISYTVTTETAIAGVASFDDLAEGQLVDTWVAGDVCAESYPEQCGAEAIRVT